MSHLVVAGIWLTLGLALAGLCLYFATVHAMVALDIRVEIGLGRHLYRAAIFYWDPRDLGVTGWWVFRTLHPKRTLVLMHIPLDKQNPFASPGVPAGRPL